MADAKHTDTKHAVTPMMAQFLEIKSRYADTMLFYRMGDFYELFFEDAEAAAEALDIVLTKRGKHLGNDIPMCGVPVHSADGYLQQLIRRGFRVAICEQVEDPAEAKKRGSKSVVKRDVVRVVTPGTLTEDTLLDARAHNYLAAFAEIRGEGALAWVDVSTGAFEVMEIAPEALPAELARLSPRELLVSETVDEATDAMARPLGITVVPLGKSAFDSERAKARVAAAFGVSTLEGFGEFTRSDLSAMGAVIEYLEITQLAQRPALTKPHKAAQAAFVQIDEATRRSLELSQTQNGKREGSLLAVIDHTVTAAGGRMLAAWLASPSRDLAQLQARQDAVGFFHAQDRLRSDLRTAMKASGDIERALSRLSAGRGGPRDLAAVRAALTAANGIAGDLAGDVPEFLEAARARLTGFQELQVLLQEALADELPMAVSDGGFIAKGYAPELDELRALRDESRSVIAALQAKYSAETAISSLKIKHNNVLGYFVEVTATHGDKMTEPPHLETFIHRQTTANQRRFTTAELSELEQKIHSASAKAQALEQELFEALRAAVMARFAELTELGQSLAEIDVTTALASLAEAQNWVAPKLTPGRDLTIRGGRHPVVEAALRNSTTPFIANDSDFTDGRIWLITGPNMAGKSTYLRQNALIAILAQIGSFVPAEAATIGLVSQIFSRVGASDDLSRGQSTFMVEMVETAAILNRADDRALVILDEIGRGTATYDGLSIAWATFEHLHEVNRCRTLFATHYHEMAALAEELPFARNATVSVKEWDGDIIFLHEVRPGTADRSYGVQVAKLAGLPDAVLNRARDVLARLEARDRNDEAAGDTLFDDLPLFSTAPATPPAISVAEAGPSALEEALGALNPDDLTPREALQALYDLKGLQS